ncbi:MAG: TonB-dependent receptor [Ignavibacteria bacterium]|nr:TonB-dependent receptor [Ignavibacteria bacterium]
MRHAWILALALFAPAQGGLHSQTVSGSVSDSRSGLPLPGANVVAGTDGRGIATDQSGRFSLRDLPPGAVTMRVTHVGYRPFETRLEISDKNISLSVVLQPEPMPGPEIEVSAIRARERQSPVTYAEIRMKDLREKYFVQDVPALLADLPSSTYYSEGGSGVGYNYLRIRGFDQRRLAVMINGVPQNDPEDHNVYWIDFADLLGSAQEIQVQRGAGSSFYGPPAIGGSINLVTGDFAAQKGIRLESGAGSFNTMRNAISFGSGLFDGTYTLFGRLSRMTTDGYRDGSWVSTNAYYFAATRYDASFTTRVTVYGGPISDGLVYYGLPKFAIGDREARRKNYGYWEAENGQYTFAVPRRPQEQEEFSQPHYELLNEWKISEAVTFNSALFHVRGQGYFDYDGTGWTDAAYYRLTPEYGFTGVSDPVNPLIRAWVDNSQVGWLPRVAIRHEGGTLTTGLELRTHRSLHWGKIQWAEGLPANLDPDRHYYEYRGAKLIASAYAQELLQLGDRLVAMANLQAVFNRYRLHDEKFVGTDFTVDYLFFNPRLGLNYNIDERWNAYTNVSWTQREPRLKNLYDAAESSGGALPQFVLNGGAYDYGNPLVTPEKLLNIEIGAGYTHPEFQCIVNGYAMRFTDEIIASGALDRFGQPITGNADRTTHVGLELSGQWHPISSIDIDANALLSRSRLDAYRVWTPDANGALTDSALDGNRIIGFPEQLANVRVTWRGSGVTASLSWKYVGDQYTDNFQNESRKVDAFSVFSLMLGYRVPPFLGLRALDMRVSVNNLFDRLYAQSGEGDQFFVGATRNVFFDLALEF